MSCACRYWQNDRLGAFRGLAGATANTAAAANRLFVPRSTFREVTWIPLPSSLSSSRDANAAQRQLVAIFTRELQSPALNLSNSSKPYTTRPPLPIHPLPVIPVCSRTVPPFVTGLCFDAPLVYDTATTVSPVLNLIHSRSGTTALICLPRPVSRTSTAPLSKFLFFPSPQSPSNRPKLSSPTTQPGSTSGMCRRWLMPSTLECRQCGSRARL